MRPPPPPHPPPVSGPLPGRVAVLGCGWLGLPLAARLAREGCAVRGSTTRPTRLPAIEAEGVEGWALRLDGPPERLRAFARADVLVVAVPPLRGEAYAAALRAFAERAREAGTPWLHFCSSTSVYPDLGREVTEADAGPGLGAAGALGRSGPDVWAAEEALRAHAAAGGPALTVWRLAGLWGPGREPGRWFAGREGVPGPDAPVNLVHLADVVEALVRRLGHPPPAQAEAFALCAPRHPARAAFYRAEASRLGLTPPTFAPGDAPWKRASGRLFSDLFGFRYAHLPGGEGA